MLPRETLEYLLKEVAPPTTIEIGEETFVSRQLHLPPEERADPLELTTLQSLVDYLDANPDHLALDRCLIHVQHPVKASLLGPLSPRHRKRERLAAVTAKNAVLSGFFDTFHAREAMQIFLQAKVVEGGDRDALLRLVGNVEAGETRTVTDDGFTQEVVVKKSAGTRERERVAGTVSLAPYRTFSEVEQPLSTFVLRFRDSPGGEVQVGLFQADGGAWELQAVQNVGKWLSDALAAVKAEGSGLAILY